MYVMGLAFSAARADGAAQNGLAGITAKEKETLLRVARILNDGPADESNPLWEWGCKSNVEPEEYAEFFNRQLKPEGKLRLATMVCILASLHADGEMNQQELVWLKRLQQTFGIDEASLTTLKSLFGSRELLDDHQEERAILGVPPGANPEIIKRAYRLKVQEFHPDRLSGVSEGVRKLAEEKLKEINAAYERLITRNGDGLLQQLWAADGNERWHLLKDMRSGELTHCSLCAQLNRLPRKEQFTFAKCGCCHGYLGLDEHQAKIVSELNGSKFVPG